MHSRDPHCLTPPGHPATQPPECRQCHRRRLPRRSLVLASMPNHGSRRDFSPDKWRFNYDSKLENEIGFESLVCDLELLNQGSNPDYTCPKWKLFRTSQFYVIFFGYIKDSYIEGIT